MVTSSVAALFDFSPFVWKRGCSQSGLLESPNPHAAVSFCLVQLTGVSFQGPGCIRILSPNAGEMCPVSAERFAGEGEAWGMVEEIGGCRRLVGTDWTRGRVCEKGVKEAERRCRERVWWQGQEGCTKFLIENSITSTKTLIFGYSFEYSIKNLYYNQATSLPEKISFSVASNREFYFDYGILWSQSLCVLTLSTNFGVYPIWILPFHDRIEIVFERFWSQTDLIYLSIVNWKLKLTT